MGEFINEAFAVGCVERGDVFYTIGVYDPNDYTAWTAYWPEKMPRKTKKAVGKLATDRRIGPRERRRINSVTLIWRKDRR